MMNENTKRSILLPFVLGIVLAGGIFIGSKLVIPAQKSSHNKISDVLDYIQQEYVDTINRDKLTEKTIEKIQEDIITELEKI